VVDSVKDYGVHLLGEEEDARDCLDAGCSIVATDIVGFEGDEQSPELGTLFTLTLIPPPLSSLE
jgi:hypothetical protein